MFDQYIILDLEMNPVEKRNWEARALLRREVIEIGAVRLDASFKAVDCFSLFVKPAYSRNVAAFITELTGIKTVDLARAVDFKTALEALSKWIGEIPACIYSWSDNDLVQLRRECAYKNIEMPSNMEAWVDAQPLYPALLGIEKAKQMSLQEAAEWYGFSFDRKRAHRALYDAEITAKLVRAILTGEYKEVASRIRKYCELEQKESVTDCGGFGVSFGELLRKSLKTTGELELA